MNNHHSCCFCDGPVKELGVDGVSCEQTGSVICFSCVAGLSDLYSSLISSGYFASLNANQVSNGNSN